MNAPPGAASEEESKAPLNRRAVLLKAPPAEYPDEFVGTGVSGEVAVTLLVDRLGRASHIRVESSPDPAFTEAAMDALSRYEFVPALRNGRVSNERVRIIVPVSEDRGDRTLDDFQGGRIELIASAVAEPVDVVLRRVFGARPAYPLELLAAGKSGEVIVEFTVGAQGVPRHIKVLESTFVEFTRAVEGALFLWSYTPAQHGTRPVATALRYRISFQADEIPEKTRAVAARLISGQTTDFVPMHLVNRQPRVRTRLTSAIRPASGPNAEETRSVEVQFLLDEKGVVHLPRVTRAPDPILGYTALAAIRYWTFEPALRKKQPVPVLLTLPVEF